MKYILALLLFGIFSFPAYAALECTDDRSIAVQRLKEIYDESMIGGGILTNNKDLIQIFTNKQGSTWTILSSRAGGKTCVIASGTNWNSLPKETIDLNGIQIDPSIGLDVHLPLDRNF